MVSFNVEKEPVMRFTLGDALINAEEREVYDGETTVTPKVKEEQTLETAGKLVTEDITVEEVPVYSVTNPTGGVTYYIGE